jgi:hypothetical protein
VNRSRARGADFRGLSPSFVGGACDNRRMATDATVPIREESALHHQVVLAEAQIARTAGEDARTTAWLNGILEALGWLLGDVDRSPVSLSSDRATRPVVGLELSRCLSVIYGPGDEGTLLEARVSGVEAALGWALGLSESRRAPMDWAESA